MSHIILPIAALEHAGQALEQAFAQENGLPYPVPGTRVTGGYHDAGGETTSWTQPRKSVAGTLCAIVSDAHASSKLGKTIKDGGFDVVFPASSVTLPDNWFESIEPNY